MSAGDYYWEREYSYNVFDADEHLGVNLWQEKSDGSLKFIQRWAWSTFLSNRWAESQFEKRVGRLVAIYDAINVKKRSRLSASADRESTQ